MIQLNKVPSPGWFVPGFLRLEDSALTSYRSRWQSSSSRTSLIRSQNHSMPVLHLQKSKGGGGNRVGKISYPLKYFRSIPYTSREVVGAFGEQGREFRPVKSAGAHCTASHRHVDVRNSAFASARAAPAFALQFRFARLKIDCVTLRRCKTI